MFLSFSIPIVRYAIKLVPTGPSSPSTRSMDAILIVKYTMYQRKVDVHYAERRKVLAER